MSDKYSALETELESLPFISPAQVERWVNLQKTIDGSRDYLIRAVPDARVNIDTAQKILAQRTYTLVFFGGTGVGKSTLINSLLGRNLLPSGAVTAVTGTIVYVEQAAEGAAETLTLNYWSKSEFAERVRRLCQLGQLDSFDITNDGERTMATNLINKLMTANMDKAKTEVDEYYEILLDCIVTYDNNAELFKADTPLPQTYDIANENAYKHLREDGFKGSSQRQIRLVKSATFRIHPKNDLLMGGFLRIVDVPGLGAGMRLHEAITLEEMKKEDAMIVLVTDGGRQRVDEMKSLAAVHWVKDNRLRGLTGMDLDEAAAKIFYVVNGGNIRQAFDRLNSGLPEAEREVREVTRHIAPNYWETYRDRGNNRPYFLVMPPSALYVQDPDNAPREFASETRRIMETFADQWSGKAISAEAGSSRDLDPLDPAVSEALLELSEVPLLREKLSDFIKTARIRTQLREAESRVRTALSSLKSYYENELGNRNVYPPFSVSWEGLQEKRFENLLTRMRKELPRAFHSSLVELSTRTNNDAAFRQMVRPVLNQIQDRVQDTVAAEVDMLLEQYGTEHWDNRDVTFDNLIWGTSGIELPIKRILFQVELTLQEAISRSMPRLGDVMTNELKRTLANHEIKSRLGRATFEQGYQFTLPTAHGQAFSAEAALESLINRIAVSFRQTCEQAVMYELMRSDRSVHHRLTATATEGLQSNEVLLDNAISGGQTVAQPAAVNSAPTPVEDEFVINILDDEPAVEFDEDSFEINLSGSDDVFGGNNSAMSAPVDLETSYASMLDDVGGKTKKLFAGIVEDLFSDDDLLPRLRRLFWLEATRAERDFNNHIIKPLLRQHDRRLHNPELRAAMEPQLESISDMESLMRTWEGLDRLESKLVF